MREPAIAKMQAGDVLRDDQVRGLHIRAFAESKGWYLYYRTRAGLQRKPKLGDWPALNLAAARRAARELLGKVAAGEDPSGDWQAERQAPTMTDLYDFVWARQWGKSKTSAEAKRIWTKYIEPKMGSKRVADVTFDDCEALFTGIKAPIMANRVHRHLHTMLELAVAPKRWIDENPANGMKLHPERKRKRKMELHEAIEIGKLLQAAVPDRPQAVAFIYLLIYSGARPDEIARATWKQYRDGKITLAEHKTDGKGGERVIHLPPQAAAVIDALPRTSGTIVGIKSPKALWEDIRKDAGCPDLWMYDLRRSFASVALSIGYSLEQVGELLGHSNSATTKRYAYLVDEIAAQAATQTGAAIADRMGVST